MRMVCCYAGSLTASVAVYRVHRLNFFDVRNQPSKYAFSFENLVDMSLLTGIWEYSSIPPSVEHYIYINIHTPARYVQTNYFESGLMSPNQDPFGKVRSCTLPIFG